MNNLNAQTFLKIPLDFKGYFKIYPPSIADTLANPDFQKFLMIFTISQEDIEDQIFGMDDDVRIQEGDIPTPYQYLLSLVYNKPEYLDLIQKGFTFFTHQEVSFLPQKGVFLNGNLEEIIASLKDLKDLENLPILPEEDYFDFQNAIRAAMGQEQLKPYDYNVHPKRRRMEAKKRYRDRVKAKQQQKHGTGGILNNLVSICCMGIGLNPLNIGEMSYAAMSALIPKYQMKEKYDIDIKSLLAGASSKKIKPKYWMQEEEKN